MGSFLWTLRLVNIRHLVTNCSPAIPLLLYPSRCASKLFSVHCCLQKLSHSGVAHSVRDIGRGGVQLRTGPGSPGSDGTYPRMPSRTSPGADFFKGEVVSVSLATSVNGAFVGGGEDGPKGIPEKRKFAVNYSRNDDLVELPGDDGGGDRAFTVQLLNRGFYDCGGGGSKGEPPTSDRFSSSTKEKLELRKQIAAGIVKNILKLQDLTLVGNLLTEWLRKFVSTVDTVETLNEHGDRLSADHRHVAKSRFVPYSQIARLIHSVMQDLGRKGHLEAALEVLRWMEKQGWCQLDPHMYTTIIAALGEVGSYELAEKIFEGLRNTQVEKDPALLNAMLHTRSKAGQIDSLEDLFDSMKRSSGCKPDLVTYNIVMNSYVKAGLGLVTVVDVFREMYAQGIHPDVVSFDVLLQACIPGRHVKEAHKIFQNMKKRGLKPSVVTYTTLITLYANTGHCTQALKILSDMLAENCLPNTRTFSSVITACGREGNMEEVERVFQAMKEFGLEPNVVTYNAMIDTYSKAGDYEMALQKYKELEVAGLKPTNVTISTLMSCLKSAGAFKEAIFFYDQAKEKSICNQHVFSEAIDTYVKWGKLQKIKDVQSDMVAVNCNPNVVIGSIILAALGSKCSSAADAVVLVNFLQGFDSDLAVNSCLLLLKKMRTDEEVQYNICRLFLLLEKEELRTLTIFTSALVDALWALGWYRRAAHVVAWVMQKGLFEDFCVNQPQEWKLDLRRLSSGTALVALYQWFGHLVVVARHLENLKSTTNLAPDVEPPLVANTEDLNESFESVDEMLLEPSEEDLKQRMPDVELLLPLRPALSKTVASKGLLGFVHDKLGSEFPPFITIVTGWGKLSRQGGPSIVKTVVQKEIFKLSAPFEPSYDSGRWMCTGRRLMPWLRSRATASRLALSDIAAEIDSKQ